MTMYVEGSILNYVAARRYPMRIDPTVASDSHALRTSERATQFTGRFQTAARLRSPIAC